MEQMTQSHLFTNTIIYNFRHELDSIIGGRHIMNMDELTKYFLPGELNTPENRSHTWKTFFEKIHDLGICQAVEVTYLKSVLKRSLNNENFDFAFIFSDIAGEGADLDTKMQTLVSFIIAERNECKKYGNAYALNYICSKVKGIGSLLVGLYVYSIFSHPHIDKGDLRVKKIEQPTSEEYYGPPIIHMGLLELSGGYQNVPALCLYSKFGFVEDESLSGSTSNCFRSETNIAMRTNYPDEMTPEEIKQKIVHILLGRESEFEKPVICKFKDPEMQGYLAWLYGEKKAAKTEYEKLKPQANFFINKLEDGSLKPEFKEKMDAVERKLEERIAKIMEISSLPRDKTYDEYKSSTAKGKPIKKTRRKKHAKMSIRKMKNKKISKSQKGRKSQKGKK